MLISKNAFIVVHHPSSSFKAGSPQVSSRSAECEALRDRGGEKAGIRAKEERCQERPNIGEGDGVLHDSAFWQGLRLG